MIDVKAIASKYPRAWHVLATFAIAIGAAGLFTALACATPPQAKTAELNLCKARSEWKKIALAAGGTLDPVPGTPRAELEAAEDVLCADLAQLPPPPTDAGKP